MCYLRGVLRWATRSVCVGFAKATSAWGCRSVYSPFTVCYHNSSFTSKVHTLPGVVNGYYTNEQCSSVTPMVDKPSRFTGVKCTHALLFHFHGPFRYHN